jgi:hypothetical protein
MRLLLERIPTRYFEVRPLTALRDGGGVTCGVTHPSAMIVIAQRPWSAISRPAPATEESVRRDRNTMYGSLSHGRGKRLPGS